MENVQPEQILIPIGMVLFIGIMLLIWGERPELWAWVRSLFADRPARSVITSSPRFEEEDEAPELAGWIAAANQAISDTNVVRAGSDRRTTQEPARLSTRMPDPEIITWLAALKDDKGGWRFSSNDIVRFVGGTRVEVLAQVRSIRNLPPPAEFAPVEEGERPTTLYRPKSGWPAQ